MHDPHELLRQGAQAQHRLRRRRYALDTDTLRKLVQQRAEAIAHKDSLRGRLNSVTRKLAEQRGARNQNDLDAAKELKSQIHPADEAQRIADSDLNSFLLAVPNIPADDAPDGGPEDPPVEIRRWGRQPTFDFEPRDHVELATSAGLLDLPRASKLSGSRFAVFRGAGAMLERALTSFLLDLHTKEHQYIEHSVPYLVTPETMTGTGQLPKFADDLFATRVADRSLYLIPTAEVPLVNLYSRETLAEDDLPLSLTAHTACFRSEAGSYGRDTRGLIRLHQFAKVELVRLCLLEEAEEQLQLLLGHAEECLQRLGLHYRVIDLRAGDLGFSARRTYDLEVWLPSQQCFREISSVSDCGDFQARRAGIRVKRGNQKEYTATLNGSGLPIGRTVVALLEQNQRSDGSVEIPPALVPYTGFHTINPDGTTL
ncbi:serine--tRNA ligase [Streptomyces nogalater]|uniref:Serine--tRNA ligase n=2 Tax=Streptomyces TaxID=1883 RepID=Q84F26_STRVF|nr:seryl-tRNA synthetase [Streptomyces viridifaciens]